MLVRALLVMPSARTLPAALPIRRQATRGFTWGLLSVIALFLLPPNLLFQFGIDYDTSGGNPAMKIGLNAVYIPHQHTWQLEHEPVLAGSGKLVILPAFRELRGHF